jgi:hypothetical protein
MNEIEWDQWREARDNALTTAQELMSVYRGSITEVFFNIYLRGYRDGVAASGKTMPEMARGEEE